MECTVRKTTDEVCDESRLMEVEKLQRLVQTLQAQNEHLMAVVGSNPTYNGDENQRKTPTINNDPPRDSGIDLSISCSDELEDDILDLDRFEMPADEESWLYTTPAAKKQDNVLSWLRKDISSLDPASRRALAIKLELLIARKQNEALKAPDEYKTAQGCVTTTPISLARILDFEEDGLHAEEPTSEMEPIPSSERELNRVNRRTTFKVDKRLSEEAAAAAAGGASGSTNSATYSRPKKTSLASTDSIKDALGSLAITAPKLLQQLAAGQALTVTNDATGVAPSLDISSGRNPALDAIHAIHPELNPNMHDIQLLASMQEEELRRCLQNLQQMNRRRRTSSGNQKEGDASPVTPQSNASGSSNSAPTPVIPAKASDRYATYTKPKHLIMPNGVAGASAMTGKYGAVNGRKVSTSAVPSQQLQNQDAIIASQRVTGLQKSLPNLSGSRSEFNLPTPSCPVDTASENGSYGDIPSALNPPNRGQATTSSTPRLTGSGSRLPTPARSRLPTPAKSVIPTPRIGPSLPVPVSASRRRNVSPGMKQPLAHTPAKESWKEGCF